MDFFLLSPGTRVFREIDDGGGGGEGEAEEVYLVGRETFGWSEEPADPLESVELDGEIARSFRPPCEIPKELVGLWEFLVDLMLIFDFSNCFWAAKGNFFNTLYKNSEYSFCNFLKNILLFSSASPVFPKDPKWFSAYLSNCRCSII